MAVITLLSAKGAPGVTTCVAALAYAWPGPVVVADCDPRGGDLATGWLSGWMLNGWLRPNVGLLSFATATRHDDLDPNKDILAVHLQTAPPAPHARLLAGLSDPAQAASVGERGWLRLASALHRLPVDVLVDAGRMGPEMPWPLIAAADLVLLGVRPLQRHLVAARPAVDALRRRIPSDRLGLAICAADYIGHKHLGLSTGMTTPDDRVAASVFSDGADIPRRFDRSPLIRSAQRAAAHLHRTLNPVQSAAPMNRAFIGHQAGGAPA